MDHLDRNNFRQYWGETEVIREYQQILYTFGDMRLPYIFLAEHNQFKDRTLVSKGTVFFNRPQIVLPGHYSGPEFAEGFEQLGHLPPEAILLFRSMGLPYSQVTNKPVAKEEIEYGSLQSVVDMFNKKLDREENTETGLIKGVTEGVEVALMRYAIGLVIKSTPENVKQFFEHLRRQQGKPIEPGERISDEDIRRLFEQ
ncbi:MAG: hypothetical protein PHF37_05165 [Phycisphaerae bacterium]|nr:hypothetical protein [Phycisphaerae bacterium]